jgi:hypothetical protein
VDQVDRALARKQPAQVIQARPIARPDATRRMLLKVEVHEAADKWALLADIHRAERRGLVRALSTAPVYNFAMNVWEMKVVRLKYPRPAWVRRTLIASVITLPTVTLLGLIWWTLTALSAPALAGMLGFILLLLLAGAAAGRSRGGSIEVVQYVKIRR